MLKPTPLPGGFFRLLLCFLFSSVLQETFGQTSRTRGELRDGKKEGIWEIYYPDGKLMARETYAAGQLHGWVHTFHPNGKSASREFWQEDLLEDSAYYFYPEGSLHRKGRYQNGLYEGCWLSFFPDGIPEQRIQYLRGMPDGRFENWRQDGSRLEEGTYREGKKDGQYIFYGSKNRISVLAQYCLDEPCGIWVWYNRRGKPAYSGQPPANK